MQFKEVDEVPVPRYDLDDSSTLVAGTSVICSSSSKVIDQQFLGNVTTLVVLAPRLSIACKSMLGRLVASINLTKTTSIPLDHEDYGDFNRGSLEEADSSVLASTQSFVVKLHRLSSTGLSQQTANTMAVLQIPVTGDEISSTLVCAVFNLLPEIKSVVMFSPGLLFDDSVAVLRGSNQPKMPLFSDFPDAVPPSFITGTVAGVLAHCEERSIESTCLIVQSDGAYGFEGIFSHHLEVLVQQIQEFTGNTGLRWEGPDLSNLYI